MTSRPETTGSGQDRLPPDPRHPDDGLVRDAATVTPELTEETADADGEGSGPAAAVIADEPVPGDAREKEPAGKEPADKAAEEPAERPLPEPGEQPVLEAVHEAAVPPVGEPIDERVEEPVEEPSAEPVEEPSAEPVEEPPAEPAGQAVADSAAEPGQERVTEPGGGDAPAGESGDRDGAAAASLLPRNAQPAQPPPTTSPTPGTAARGRLSRAMRPHVSRAQLLGGLLCALLGFALVVQARQTQTQGLDQLRQTDLVRLLDNVTNAEARAEQDVRSEQAIRDRLLSGSDSSEAAQQAAQERLDTLGLLAGTVPASGPGIELDIADPRRQVDASVLLDTLEELRDGGAEVIQIGDVRVVAATAFTDDADGVRVDGRLLTPPYRYKVIGEPQTLAKVLQIPGGVLDVLRSKGAQGRVTQGSTVRVDALRAAVTPQYARPAPGGTP